MDSAILLVQCPDRKGVDAAIGEVIDRYDGNTLHFERHGEDSHDLARFFLNETWSEQRACFRKRALQGWRSMLRHYKGAQAPQFGMNKTLR